MTVFVSTHYDNGNQIGTTAEFGSVEIVEFYIKSMWDGHGRFADHFIVTTDGWKAVVRRKKAKTQSLPAKTPEELQDGMPF